MKRYLPFLITLFLILGGWFWVSWLTWDAPHADGMRAYGFPLPFYGWGGLCVQGAVCTYFYLPALLLDAAILLSLPPFVQWLAGKWQKRKK